MAHYNFKELRDALPPEMVEKWEKEDGSADYNSTLWSYGAQYIRQLERELNEINHDRKVAMMEADTLRQHLKIAQSLLDNPEEADTSNVNNHG